MSSEPGRYQHADERSVGKLYAWSRGDSLPTLPTVPGLTTGRGLDLVSRVSGLDRESVEELVRDGNAPYAAALDGEPVAVGWSAHRFGRIGELGMTLDLPIGERYLWDFRTLPEYRGRGIYPRLLQALIREETDAQRFWIGHDAANVASGKGILKAGFTLVGEVWIGAEGPRLVAMADDDRARAAAALLGLPLVGER